MLERRQKKGHGKNLTTKYPGLNKLVDCRTNKSPVVSLITVEECSLTVDQNYRKGQEPR